jgi:hypothetical protein
MRVVEYSLRSALILYLSFMHGQSSLTHSRTPFKTLQLCNSKLSPNIHYIAFSYQNLCILRGGGKELSESEDFFSESVGEDTKEDLNNTQTELNTLTAEMNEVLVRLTVGTPTKVLRGAHYPWRVSRITASISVSRRFKAEPRDFA